MAENRERETGETVGRESGQPGGGQGRTDEVGRTGVYPGSGPYPESPTEARTPAGFVHGKVDEEGHPIEDSSEITSTGPNTAVGGATPPPSGSPTTQEGQRPGQASGS